MLTQNRITARTLSPGKPVCSDSERIACVRGCKWVDEVIEGVPYMIDDAYLRDLVEKHQIDYVVHGDDPCIVNGKNAYESAIRMGPIDISWSSPFPPISTSPHLNLRQVPDDPSHGRHLHDRYSRPHAPRHALTPLRGGLPLPRRRKRFPGLAAAGGGPEAGLSEQDARRGILPPRE